MKVMLIKNGGDIIDVTQITGEFKIKGAAKECSRTLDLPLLRKVDYYTPDIKAELGDIIDIVDEKDGEIEKIFKGVVWEIELEDNSAEQQLTVYDYAVYLNKSHPKTSVYTNKTASEVSAAIIKEMGLKSGKLAEGVKESYNGRDMTAYDLIMHAYTKANKKNQKKYKLVAKGDEIHVIESGKRHPLVLEELSEAVPGKLLSTSYRQSLDDMVNKVAVVDEKKKDEKKEKDEKKKSQDQYGVVQKVIRGEKADIKGTMKDAKIEASVEVIADWDMITGINVELKSSVLEGEFYIISDEHTYFDGIHKAHLTLSTEFEMDTKDEGGSKSEDGDDSALPSGTVGSMISAGKSKIGSHYKWGHTGPNTFDCSGFVSWCAIQAGLMPPGSRLTSGSMPAKYVHKVSWNEIRPGDVVHYRGSPGHVAIYVGNGQVLECGGTSSSKIGYSGVAITPMNARNHKFKNVYRFNKSGGD